LHDQPAKSQPAKFPTYNLHFVPAVRYAGLVIRVALLHFFIIDFAAFTPDSAFPLAFECVRAGGQCSKSHSTAKSWNSWEANWGPLSLIRVQGTPCLEKCDTSFFTTASMVVLLILSTSLLTH
jgi:hypothetical protein